LVQLELNVFIDTFNNMLKSKTYCQASSWGKIYPTDTIKSVCVVIYIYIYIHKYHIYIYIYKLVMSFHQVDFSSHHLQYLHLCGNNFQELAITLQVELEAIVHISI